MFCAQKHISSNKESDRKFAFLNTKPLKDSDVFCNTPLQQQTKQI